MLTSSIKVFTSINFILLVSLVFISFYLNKENYGDFLLVSPKTNSFYSSISYSAEDVEKINDKGYMITYEEHKNTIINVLGKNYEVVIRETNFLYPSILNFQMVSGGFFSNNAQQRESKSIVLNKQSAFEIFGNYDIIGSYVTIEQDDYIVVGVINDNDEKTKNIYIPITVSNNIPTIFMLYFQENSIESVKNELSNIGITDLNYNFIHLGLLSEKIYDKAVIAIGLMLCCIIFLTLNTIVKKLLRQIDLLKQYSKLYYFMDIITKNFTLIIRFIFTSLFILGLSGSISYILIIFFNIFLRWYSFLNELNEYYYPAFYTKISVLRNFELLSDVILGIYVICIIISILLILIKNNNNSLDNKIKF